jgi:molybdopterin-biosynthesis enzyme MoeA-like protein
MGVTTNTNATFIGRHLTRLGYEVRRVTCVRDDVALAVEFFQEVFVRKPDLIIISGGLGPTYDDIQLEVLSKATGIELEENVSALEQIIEYYQSKDAVLTKDRRKMSFMPIGSIVLKNHVGGAPSCYLSYKEIDIYCLPGVPTEMKDIFTRYIVPRLKEKNDLELYERKFQIFQSIESQLAPYILKIKNKFSNLYIKSHPAYKDKVGIVIHISGLGKDANTEVDQAIVELQEIIKENIPNIRIEPLVD